MYSLMYIIGDNYLLITPLAFSFLTKVFLIELLDNPLSGHISCKGEFSCMLIIILLMVFLITRLFLYYTSVLVGLSMQTKKTEPLK